MARVPGGQKPERRGTDVDRFCPADFLDVLPWTAALELLLDTGIGAIADWDQRPLRLDKFAVDDPANGFAAMASPSDPKPGVDVATWARAY